MVAGLCQFLGKLIYHYILFVQPCPACDVSVGVLHALLECPRPRDAWVVLCDACPLCPSRDVHLAFLQFIFCQRPHGPMYKMLWHLVSKPSCLSSTHKKGVRSVACVHVFCLFFLSLFFFLNGWGESGGVRPLFLHHCHLVVNSITKHQFGIYGLCNPFCYFGNSPFFI